MVIDQNHRYSGGLCRSSYSRQRLRVRDIVFADIAGAKMMLWVEHRGLLFTHCGGQSHCFERPQYTKSV